MRDKIELVQGAETLGANFGVQDEVMHAVNKHTSQELTYAQIIAAIWNDPEIPDLIAAGAIMFIGALEQIHSFSENPVELLSTLGMVIRGGKG